MTTKMDRENILYTKYIRGVETGREEGREEGKLEIARNLKALGVDIDTIMKATGLSGEEVQAL